MGPLVAIGTHADQMLDAVRRQEPGLAPDMRNHLRPAYTAHLADMAIAPKRAAACPIHAHQMKDVHTDVKCHAQRQERRQSPAEAEDQQAEEQDWVVEQPRARVLRRVRPIEVAHGGDGIQAALAEAEPGVMIHINQDARHPRHERSPAQPWGEQGRRGARNQHMISNSHPLAPYPRPHVPGEDSPRDDTTRLCARSRHSGALVR